MHGINSAPMGIDFGRQRANRSLRSRSRQIESTVPLEEDLPSGYTGPWGKKERVTYRQHGQLNPSSMAKHPVEGWREMSKTAMVEDLPWYMQGEGGGMLGRRRSEVEGINPQEIYGLSAPSVRKTTEGLISGIEEDASRRNLSPAMVALARKSLLKGELEGLGSAAGQAAAGAYGQRESSRAGLAGMEASLGTHEMQGRRGATRSRIPLQQQSRTFARQDRKQRESQARLSRFWSSYGR